MIGQLAPERPAEVAPSGRAGSPTGLVAAAAAVRGAAVAVSGVILASGLALLIWALTPASGSAAADALRGGVVVFAAANLMPVSIDGISLTLPPLLLTIAICALFGGTARRGRFLPEGRYQEVVSVAVTACSYGVLAAVICRGLGPQDAVPPGGVWTSFAMALVATSAGMLTRGSAWHGWWHTATSDTLRCAVRGGGIGAWVLLGGGALAFSAGVLAHFSTVVGVAAVAAPSWLDGLGMAMLGLAYLPNAVIAGTGYVTGVGFEIGPGTYTPFGTATVDLPAVPLLAAAPDHAGRSPVGLLFLLVPVVAGYLLARPAIRHLPGRAGRVLAVGSASLVAGTMLAAVTAIARGGIGGGRWASIGAPPLLVGAVAAAEVGVVAVAVATLTGLRSVPWQLDASEAAGLDAGDADPRDPAENTADKENTPDDEVLGDEDLGDEVLGDEVLGDGTDGAREQAGGVLAEDALAEDALADAVAEDALDDDGAADGGPDRRCRRRSGDRRWGRYRWGRYGWGRYR